MPTFVSAGPSLVFVYKHQPGKKGKNELKRGLERMVEEIAGKRMCKQGAVKKRGNVDEYPSTTTSSNSNGPSKPDDGEDRVLLLRDLHILTCTTIEFHSLRVLSSLQSTRPGIAPGTGNRDQRTQFQYQGLLAFPLLMVRCILSYICNPDSSPDSRI